MKRQSVKALLKYLSASFPNQLKFPKGDEDKDKMIISTWYDWLKEIDEGKAKMAVKQAAFDNPKWVPSPPSILKAVQRIESDYPSPSKAWQLARKKDEYNRERSQTTITKGDVKAMHPEMSEDETKEEYDKQMPDKVKIPELVSEAMTRFDGKLTGKVDQMHFIRSQFIATYQEVLEEKEAKLGREKYLNPDEETTYRLND